MMIHYLLPLPLLPQSTLLQSTLLQSTPKESLPSMIHALSMYMYKPLTDAVEEA